MLGDAFIFGLISFWCIAGIRTISFVESRMLAEAKPWACNFCMSFWVTGALVVLAHYTHVYPFHLVRSLLGAAFAFGLMGLSERASPSPFLPKEDA